MCVLMLIFVEVFYVSKITTRQNSHFSRRHPALPSHAFPRFPRFPRPSGRHGGGVGHGNDGGGGGGVRHGHVAGLHGGGVRHGHITTRGNAESGQLSLVEWMCSKMLGPNAAKKHVLKHLELVSRNLWQLL